MSTPTPPPGEPAAPATPPTKPAASATSSGPPASPAASRIREAVTTLLANCGLHIEQRRLELIVTNLRDPERGQVCITLDDGYVSWERTETSYWGVLEGIATGQGPDPRSVPASKIIETLTGRM